jgi:hypothetical protein
MIVQVDRFFPGQTGRLGRGDRLDQTRIVIPDIADAPLFVDEHRDGPTPFPNRGSDLRYLLVGIASALAPVTTSPESSTGFIPLLPDLRRVYEASLGIKLACGIGQATHSFPTLPGIMRHDPGNTKAGSLD